MKHEITTYSLIGILAITTLLSIKQCSEYQEKSQKIETDTIFSDKYIQVPPTLKVVEIPKEVIIYKNLPILKIDTIILRDSFITLVQERDSVNYSNQFLTSFTREPKLIGLQISKNKLSLDLLTPEGISKEERFDIDTDKFRYSYSQGKLTKKKSWNGKFDLTTSYSFRPFHTFHDFNILGNFNTSHIKFGIGPGLFYYPNLRDDPGYDLLLNITYRF